MRVMPMVWSGSKSRARPKSITTMRPCSVSITFDGFTSRCSTPAAWTGRSAAATRPATSSTSASVKGSPRLRRMSTRVRPVEQLHDQVGGAVLLEHLVDAHDARVGEPGQHPGLAQEPLAADRNAARACGGVSTIEPWRTADSGNSSLTATRRFSRVSPTS